MGQVNPDTTSSSYNEIFVDPQIPAVFPGGEQALFRFIADSLRYPSKCMSISGTVYLSVKISKDGLMGDPELKRGLHPFIDDEALRVISLLPREWKPARMGNVPVDSEYILPIRFTLN